MQPLLHISNLKTHFFTSHGVIRAVDGISFDVGENESVGLVGESGSGKSVTALSIMRLVPSPPGKIVEGEIMFKGENILDLNLRQMQMLRGKKIAMSFQDPLTYLNPVQKVGDQIAESILIHERIGKKEAFEKAIEIMEKVKISDPSRRAKDYPHQLSGGMRQRCLLGIALSCRPNLLIADEPTTMLDVITQDAILELLRDLKNEFNLSIMVITHNLGIVAGFAQKVIIMYAGEISEIGNVRPVFHGCYHPYTRALFRSVPRIDVISDKLSPIRGSLADPIHPPSGCKFHPRCDHVKGVCKTRKPELIEVESGHFVACHLYKNV